MIKFHILYCIILVTENANFAPSGDEEKVTVNVNGTVKVTGELTDEVEFSGNGTVQLANEDDEKNGTNLTNAFNAGAKNVDLTSDATLSVSETTITGNFTVDEGVTFTTESGAHFTDNGKVSNVAINGTWKVEGEIRDLNGCTFGANSTIELASQTESQNGQSLVICVDADVPNIQLDKNATITSELKVDNKDLKLTLAKNASITRSGDGRGIEVASGKTLTITGEDKDTSKIVSSGSNNDGTSFIKSEGNLNVENVTIDTNGYGIYAVSGNVNITDSALKSANYPCLSTNGKYSESSEITLTGSTLTSINDVAIYLPANKKTTLTKCIIEGKTGIEILAGELEVNDTIFNYSKKIDDQITEKTNGSVNAGGAIFVRAQNEYIKEGSITVKVTGVTTFNYTGEDSEGVTEHVAKYCGESCDSKVTISGVDQVKTVNKNN